MSDYSDTELQAMTDEQLDEVYRNLPKWPEAAGVIDTCVRVAKEYRYRQRFRPSKESCNSVYT